MIRGQRLRPERARFSIFPSISGDAYYHTLQTMKYVLALPLLCLVLTGCFIAGSSPPHLQVQVTTDIERTIMERVRPQEYMPLVSWSDTLVLTRELDDRFGRIHPMLFFEPGQSDIPARYQQLAGPEEASRYRTWQVAEYSFLELGWSRAKQAELLDVLGKWLHDVDNSEVSVQGGYSSEEGESEEVANRRAQAVRDYLTRVWEVDPARIHVLPSLHLARPSDHVLAQQEARTVRIYPSATYFLEDISFNTTRHPGFIPVGLRLKLGGAEEGEWVRATLNIVSGDDTLTQSRLPLPQPPPDFIERKNVEYLIDEYALWTIPRDVRYLQSPLRVSATLTRTDGSTLRTDEVPIYFVVIEQGKHQEFRDGYGTSLVADNGDFDFAEHRNEFREWLGNDIKPSTPIRFELNTFSYHDGELTPVHVSVINRNVERLRNEIEKDTSRRWRMKVVASVDEIEWDDVDHADIERIAGRMSVTTALADGKVIGGGIRPHLYFPSGRIAELLRSGPEEGYRDIVRVMFEGRDWGLEESGLRGMGIQWVYPYDTVDLHRRTYPQRSATRRAAEVAGQLVSLLGDIPFDRVAHDATNAKSFLSPEPPEHRIRDREVTIIFYNDRSYEWFMDETGREWGRVQVR